MYSPSLLSAELSNLSDDKTLTSYKLESYADNNVSVSQVMHFFFDRLENIVANGK